MCGSGTIGSGDSGWALRLALGLAVFVILTALLSTYLGRGTIGSSGSPPAETFFAGPRPPTSAALQRRKLAAAAGYKTVA